jgi:hypothetical protein
MYVVFLALAADFFHVPSLIHQVWVVALFFWLLLLLVIIVMSRAALISIGLFVGQAVVSVLLSFYLYHYVLSQGVHGLLPSSQDVVLQFWLLLGAYAYAVLNQIQMGSLVTKRENAIAHRYTRLFERFWPCLTADFQAEKALRNVFFTFMLIEDLNRPSWVRGLERLSRRNGLPWGRTTGIMQVTSRDALSDDESVARAQPIVRRIFEKFEERFIAEFGRDGAAGDDVNLGDRRQDVAKAYVSRMYDEYKGGDGRGADDVFKVVCRTIVSN